MKDEQSHTRGLVRRRRVATPPQARAACRRSRRAFWLWTVTVLLAWAIFYWRKNAGEIESQKAALVRASSAASSLSSGPRFDPLQQAHRRLDRGTLRGPTRATWWPPSSGRGISATLPGIYLRLRLSDATSVDVDSQGGECVAARWIHGVSLPRAQHRPRVGPALQGIARLRRRDVLQRGRSLHAARAALQHAHRVLSARESWAKNGR